MNSKTKQCQNCKNKFTIEPEDFEFYKKIDVPEPTFCPDCRAQRRMVFRNEMNLYKRKCDFSGKDIISMFPQNAPVKVYERDIWWSDKWDPMEYGKDYDFNKPFFEQLNQLIGKMPWPSRTVSDIVNSDYSINASFLKNCYLVSNSAISEDCAYSSGLEHSKDSYDSYDLRKSELCYECFMVKNCYKIFFSSYCDNCQEVFFSKDCIGCQNCFGCVNLRHKKYHIFNKQYTKEEYFKKLKEFNLGSFKNIEELNKKAKDFLLEFPNKYMHGRKNVDVTGDYIYNCKNVKDSYVASNTEDSRYCQFTIFTKTYNCYDSLIVGWGSKLTYEVSASGHGLNKVKFCFECWPNCHDLEYSINCHSSSNLFTCIGLRNKSYCILNKQYTKEEYNELVPKIIKHMNDMPYTDKKGRIYKYGEFFPIELSPFAYNKTIANEYFPLTKEQVLKQGYTWYDKPKPEYKATITASNLSDYIKDIDKSILKEVIECNNEKNNTCAGSGVFRLIPQELKFYKKMNLPLPRLCPDCRHKERIKQRNPMKLYKRQCMNKGCSNAFQTTYSPDRKEIVYCEKCYNEEVE